MLQFIVDATGKSTGQYTGYIDVNAGAAGSQRVTVTVKVVQNLKEVFLPVVTR
jgi:6-phosphogluconolactonase/glucosamine-6-phosphate isomerase/deaminase